MKTDISHVAAYLFVVGLIVAVIAGISASSLGSVTQAWISVAFVVLGAAIGAFMATSKKLEEEIYVLVLAMLALLVAVYGGAFGSLGTAAPSLGPAMVSLGTTIQTIVGYIAMFSAASIIVLAIRTLTNFHISKIR